MNYIIQEDSSEANYFLPKLKLSLNQYQYAMLCNLVLIEANHYVVSKEGEVRYYVAICRNIGAKLLIADKKILFTDKANRKIELGFEEVFALKNMLTSADFSQSNTEEIAKIQKKVDAFVLKASNDFHQETLAEFGLVQDIDVEIL